MIRYVKFKNFYSFRDEQEISFVSSKKTTADYFKSKSGHDISKVLGVIGTNASGKTNIMRLFSFLTYFICSSNLDIAPEEYNVPFNLDMAFKTFFQNEQPAYFYLEYENENSEFFYTLEIKGNTVMKEILDCRRIKKGSHKENLITRKGISIKLNDKYFEGFQAQTKFFKNIRGDVSLISFLKSHYEIPVVNTIYSYFNKIKSNINEQGQINNFLHQYRTLEMYMKDSVLKKQVEDFISRFDLGLKSFDIQTKTLPDNRRTIVVQGIHQAGSEKKLEFKYESRGSQSLFFTLANLFSALKSNGIVIIDEIEIGLHPEAVSKLISYFIDQNTHTNAQLIFSSHSYGFMDRFDMHQIYLTEKDNRGQSEVYRLNQVEGIRSDERFSTKYMTGAYGAFPKIRV